MTLEPALSRLEMPVPDSAFARAARERVTDEEPAFLLNHSIRAYAWAVELARHDGLAFDAEILYVAALWHDVGLVPKYDLGGCFELDGAIAAERFALDAGQPPERARGIKDAIALHMIEELPPEPAAEVVLLWDSTGVDVTGFRYEDVRPEIVPPVLGAYPRLDFKREFGRLFAEQATAKPRCRVAEMVRTGKLAAIEAAPFDS